MTPILGITASSITPFTLGDFESIATVTVGSGGSANITFSSIPSDFQHLQIRLFGRTTRAANQDAVLLELNGDSGNNYQRAHYLYGDGSSAAAGSDGLGAYGASYRIAAATSASNIFGTIIYDLLDYTSTNKHKTARILGGYDRNGGGEIWFSSFLWFPSTIAAINSIKLTPSTGGNFVEYSQAALYGIKG